MSCCTDRTAPRRRSSASFAASTRSFFRPACSNRLCRGLHTTSFATLPASTWYTQDASEPSSNTTESGPRWTRTYRRKAAAVVGITVSWRIRPAPSRIHTDVVATCTSSPTNRTAPSKREECRAPYQRTTWSVNKERIRYCLKTHDLCDDAGEAGVEGAFGEECTQRLNHGKR